MKAWAIAGGMIILSTVCWAGPNDSQLTTREQQVQTQQEMRNDMRRTEEASKPNERSAPTKVDVSTWGINSNAVFEITNHLFGYSTILESDNTFQGVKMTGFLNLAFYSPTKNNDGERKKGRLVFGFETPAYEFSKRSDLFVGGGLTWGDARGLYLDCGYEYHILGWLKGQAGLNYNSARGLFPQLSLGMTW